MTSGGIETNVIELAILKNPNMDPGTKSVALLEVTLAQELWTQIKNPEHGRFHRFSKAVYSHTASCHVT